MLGCNESNITFQQHLCKLGQLRRSNGRNSPVLGQAMKKRPTDHYRKYSHFKGRDIAPTTSSRVGSCIIDSSTLGERTLLHARAAHAILSRDRTVDDEIFCMALPIHLRAYTIYVGIVYHSVYQCVCTGRVSCCTCPHLSPVVPSWPCSRQTEPAGQPVSAAPPSGLPSSCSVTIHTHTWAHTHTYNVICSTLYTHHSQLRVSVAKKYIACGLSSLQRQLIM